MTRIVILGGPRTGKTTLANSWSECPVGTPVRHTDDLIPLGWSEASQAASLWFDEPGPWIIEGVAAVRALRKWRDQHPGERPPVDRVIALWEPHVTLSKGQATMAKGVESVWREIVMWLIDSGVLVEGRGKANSGDEPAREGSTPAHQHPRMTDAP